MRFIAALCTTSHAIGEPAEIIAKDLVTIFEESSRTHILLKTVIDTEVTRTGRLCEGVEGVCVCASLFTLSTLLVRPANLFRDNTMNSQIISAYCKNIGSDYLKEVLKGLIKCTSIHSADTLEVNHTTTTPPHNHPLTLILFHHIDRSSANQLCNNNTRAERGKTRYRCRNVSLSHHSPILISLSCVSLFLFSIYIVCMGG